MKIESMRGYFQEVNQYRSPVSALLKGDAIHFVSNPILIRNKDVHEREKSISIKQ